MAETIYYVDAFQTTDFNDASFVEREILMKRTLCRYTPDNMFGEKCLAMVTPITGSTMGDEMLYISKERVGADFESASATNLITGDVIQFNSRNELSKWVYNAPISELLNYIFEAHFTSEKGKTTIKYFADIADFEVPDDKKAKVYRFEVSDRNTNDVVGKLSFDTNGCNKGINKIERALKNQKNNMNEDDYIFRLNGVDISGYFQSPSITNIFYQKKESDLDGARFRVEYFGACKIMEHYEMSYRLAKAIYGEDSELMEKVRLECDSKIEKLKKILEEDKRVHPAEW